MIDCLLVLHSIVLRPVQNQLLWHIVLMFASNAKRPSYLIDFPTRGTKDILTEPSLCYSKMLLKVVLVFYVKLS